MKTSLLLGLCVAIMTSGHAAPAEPQPFLADTQRLMDAAAFLGPPKAAGRPAHPR